MKEHKIEVLDSEPLLRMIIGLLLIYSNVLMLCHGTFSYFMTIFGVIMLISDFVAAGRYDHGGMRSEKVSKIIRYMLAVLLLALSILMLHTYFAMPNQRYSSLYATVVYLSVAAYLVAYKPSNTTIVRKILKAAGYIFILGPIYLLQPMIDKLQYLPVKNIGLASSYVMVMAIINILGFLLLYFGRKTKGNIIHDDVERQQRIDGENSTQVPDSNSMTEPQESVVNDMEPTIGCSCCADEMLDDVKNVRQKQKQMQEQQKKLKDSVLYCKHCGKKIESDSIFCKYCGKNLIV